ncbi:MAG: hypothetical protein M8861_12855 [marine benthic group bacterium]|nr:hypothetical protein [Gemmatimonadota bacterium]
MRSPVSDLKPLALVVAALLLAGCGDDEPTGPEFGDLEFSPASPVLIGAARQAELELFNRSNGALGPLALGAGVPLSFPGGEFVCPGLEIVITPNQIQSIGAGGSTDVVVDFSFAGLDEEECPLATYEADINAALGNTVLGSSQIRLDHTELE